MNSIRSTRRRFILLMLSPVTLLMLLLTLVPFFVSFYLSFTDYSLLRPNSIQGIGFQNYIDLFKSSDFWNSVRITVWFTVFAVVLQTFLGVGVAALLHYETKQAPWLRLIYLLPMAITPVAATFTFRIMFDPTLGVLNYFLTNLGFLPSEWIASPKTALFSLVLVDTWQWTPFIMLIAVGGMAALPREVEEASSVDGAGRLRTFFCVMLPQLKPYLVLALLFRLIDAFKTFDIIFILTGGGPGIATRTLNLLAYKNGIEFLSMGYASAIAVVMLLFILFIGQISLRKLGLFDIKG